MENVSLIQAEIPEQIDQEAELLPKNSTEMDEIVHFRRVLVIFLLMSAFDVVLVSAFIYSPELRKFASESFGVYQISGILTLCSFISRFFCPQKLTKYPRCYVLVSFMSLSILLTSSTVFLDPLSILISLFIFASTILGVFSYSFCFRDSYSSCCSFSCGFLFFLLTSFIVRKRTDYQYTFHSWLIINGLACYLSFLLSRNIQRLLEKKKKGGTKTRLPIQSAFRLYLKVVSLFIWSFCMED